MLPKLNSSHGSETRNIINRAIEVLNVQGKTIQDLVADGQLTGEQYANLITTINGMIKSGEVDKSDLAPELRSEVDTLQNKIDKGEVSVYDINKNKGKFDQSYMTTEFLEQMTGTTPVNAVPSRGGIVSNHLSKRLVTPNHLDFVVVSDNMLNSNNFMTSTSIDFTTGEPVANDYNDLSDFIPVDGNRDYVFNHVSRWALYDESKGFIETGTASSVTTTGTNYFIRLVIPNTRTKEAQMNEGSTLLPYDKYKVELKRTDENGFLIKPSQKTVDKEAMLKDSVSPYALEIIKKPNNLFNMHDVTFGKVISSADELVDDETMVTMNEYITVEPNETLAKRTDTSAIVAFYDIDKQIGERTAINMDVPNFTTPEYCHYMKISVKTAAYDWFMLNRGDTVLPHEDYEFTFQSTDKYPLRIEGATSINDNISPFRSYNYEQGTYAELVDSLADTGCTVEQLGISSDGTNNLYGIHYGDLVNKPTVLVVGAQHGSEWVGAHYPIEFMRRIANADYYDEDVINSLRDTFGFYCIVAANPYGYENVSYTNANGVNLNRNYDNNWESYEVTHPSQEKGTAPFSEPETQIIRDKFLELQPILAFDCHTTGETPGGIDIGGSTSPHRDLLLEADKELRQIFDDASLSTQQWNSTGGPTMSGWVRNQTSKEGITPVHGMVEQPVNYNGDYGLTALFHLTLKVKELYEGLQ